MKPIYYLYFMLLGIMLFEWSGNNLILADLDPNEVMQTAIWEEKFTGGMMYTRGNAFILFWYIFNVTLFTIGIIVFLQSILRLYLKAKMRLNCLHCEQMLFECCDTMVKSCHKTNNNVFKKGGKENCPID